jgi:cytidylate kinase
MIICFFGASCVGKTTFARRISDALQIPLRSCGDAVRAQARASGVHIQDLSDTLHREIDAATVAWALEQKTCIVEGRFLDAVFRGVGAPSTLIKFSASKKDRISRAMARSGNLSYSASDLDRVDIADAEFQARLYEDMSGPAVHPLVFDTSDLTVNECIPKILPLVKDALSWPRA